MPTLNIVKLGNNNRLFGKPKGGPTQHVSDLDKLELLSSSSGDQSKQKIKDIVFDPRSRKRLLDTLNIITTRDKWKNLNLSD